MPPEPPSPESDSPPAGQKSTGVRPIEPLIHFVWYGKSLPDFTAIAIGSALRHNPQCKVQLWHERQLEPCVALKNLRSLGLQQREIDFAALGARAQDQGCPFDVDRLTNIYTRLTAPAARSNLLRQLILYVEGGVYLDTDTLTLRSLTELRQLGGFCGLEHVLWPSHRRKYHVGALGLDGLRWLYGRLPGGHGLHRRLLRFYDQAANNAVLGFKSRHPFSEGLLQAATDVPEQEWLRRFRFGTHLLQQRLAVASMAHQEHPVAQLHPDYFYPQGPMISLQYFRKTKHVAEESRKLLGSRAHVIHWYASVGKLLHFGAEHIRARSSCEVYSHLCEPYLHLLSEGSTNQ